MISAKLVPAMVGEATFPPGFSPVPGDLSLRWRKTHVARRADVLRLGPIPAHAGGTATTTPAATPSPAYPRARGGNQGHLLQAWTARGLSPRTRGEPEISGEQVPQPVPIPAHAGGGTVCVIIS